MISNFFHGNHAVEKSIFIEKPAKSVFQKVLDLKSWNTWSPTL